MGSELARYDAHWSAFFGLDAQTFVAAGLHIVEHAGLAGYAGLWFFQRGASAVVSAPAEWIPRLQQRADALRAHPIPSPELVREHLGAEPVRIIGPVFQGALLEHGFRRAPHPNVRRLTDADAPLLRSLRDACSAEEWEHSTLSLNPGVCYGCIVDSQLTAAATLDPRAEGVVGPGVLSHPAMRGRGHATAVVSAAVEHALAADMLVMYQTPLAATASVAVAKRLGFQHYATHLAVRV